MWANHLAVNQSFGSSGDSSASQKCSWLQGNNSGCVCVVDECSRLSAPWVFKKKLYHIKTLDPKDQKTEIHLWVNSDPDEVLCAFCTFPFCLALSFGKKGLSNWTLQTWEIPCVETAYSRKISVKPFESFCYWSGKLGMVRSLMISTHFKCHEWRRALDQNCTNPLTFYLWHFLFFL